MGISSCTSSSPSRRCTWWSVTPPSCASQFDTMIELAKLPMSPCRSRPTRPGQYEARRLGAFSLVTHPWGHPRVHIEGYGGGRFITDADEVSYFARAFEHAGRIALSPG